VLSPVAIAALVLTAPLCCNAGEATALAPREVASVTQARAEAIVRCVSEAARRWRQDHAPGAAWVYERGSYGESCASPEMESLPLLETDVLAPSAPLLELDLDLPPPAVSFVAAC
jgi:hypothetical protein